MYNIELRLVPKPVERSGQQDNAGTPQWAVGETFQVQEGATDLLL